MRASSSAALAAAMLIGGGCGGGGGKHAAAVPDPAAIRTVVSGFAKAFGTGDGARSCTLLTPAARTAFVKRVKSLVRSSDCATAIKRVHDDAGGSVTSAIATATVGAVKVTGPTATAELTAGGHATTVRLAKQGGAWKLAGLPGT